MDLLRLNQEELGRRLRDLKDVEQTFIASLMEQIDTLSSQASKLPKEEVLLKLQNFRTLLDKYSGSNPEWTSIGKGRVDQLQKDLTAAKGPKKMESVDDFFIYSDDEDENEDFMVEDDNNEDNMEDEAEDNAEDDTMDDWIFTVPERI